MKPHSAAVVVTILACVGYFLWGRQDLSEAAKPPIPGTEVAPTPTPVVPGVMVAAADVPVHRLSVARESTDAEKPKLPWDPSVLVHDPYWTVPTDLKQNMHWHINNNALMRGEMVPPTYSCSVSDMAMDPRVNPKRLELTEQEANDLRALLASEHETLAAMGKEEWRLKGVALHEAVERGDYLTTGAMNGSSVTPLTNEQMRKRLEPVVDQEAVLQTRFGARYKDYFTTVCCGPPPKLNEQHIIFVPRSRAPQAFEIYDECIRVKEYALQKARDYFANLQR